MSAISVESIDGSFLDSSSVASVGRVLITSAVLIFSTMITSCNWRASDIAIVSMDAYHTRENLTAEKRQGTNFYSAAGFLALAGFGAASAIASLGSKNKSLNLFIACLAIYWFWCGMATFWSGEFGISLKKYFILVLLVVGMLGLTRLLSLEELIWCAVLCSAVLIGTGLVAEVMLGNFRPQSSEYRFSGLVHTNSQSFFGAILCIASFCLQPRSTVWQSVRWMFFLGGVLCIVLTKSRTAMGGLLVTSILVSIVACRGWWRSVMISLLGVVSCVAVLLVATFGTSLSQAIFGVAAMGRGEHTESLTGRVPLWQELFVALAEKPLLGYGFGAFWNSKRVTYYSEMFSWEIPSGHSMYIDAALELGLIGAILFVGTLVIGFVLATIRYKRDPITPNLFPLAIICFAFVHGFTESQFTQGGYGGMWLMVSLLTLATTYHSPLATNQNRKFVQKRPSLGPTRSDAYSAQQYLAGPS